MISIIGRRKTQAAVDESRRKRRELYKSESWDEYTQLCKQYVKD